MCMEINRCLSINNIRKRKKDDSIMKLLGEKILGGFYEKEF